MMQSTQREQVGENLYAVDVEGAWGTESFAATVTARVTCDDSNLNGSGEPAWCAELATVIGCDGQPTEIPGKAIEYALTVIETNDPGVTL